MHNLLYKAEKPSVRPQFLIARIDIELTREEAPNFWGDQVYLKEFVTATE